LYDLDRPVIAAVDGPAFGAGFSLALLADFILVSTRARFCMAFGRIGLVPDYGALYTLPRVVGLQRAKELMMSAREVGAAEALNIGLALEVLAPEALMPRAMQMARALSSASPSAMSITKDALNGSLDSDLDSLLKLEAASQAVAGTSDYHKEATRRFVEKQAPQFQWPATAAAKP
jgi:2-(1,2-epoxy-1,2-dihydrophenyl)acetyl-CoA isomerase